MARGSGDEGAMDPSASAAKKGVNSDQSDRRGRNLAPSPTLDARKKFRSRSVSSTSQPSPTSANGRVASQQSRLSQSNRLKNLIPPSMRKSSRSKSDSSSPAPSVGDSSVMEDVAAHSTDHAHTEGVDKDGQGGVKEKKRKKKKKSLKVVTEKSLKGLANIGKKSKKDAAAADDDDELEDIGMGEDDFLDGVLSPNKMRDVSPDGADIIGMLGLESRSPSPPKRVLKASSVSATNQSSASGAPVESAPVDNSEVPDIAVSQPEEDGSLANALPNMFENSSTLPAEEASGGSRFDGDKRLVKHRSKKITKSVNGFKHHPANARRENSKTISDDSDDSDGDENQVEQREIAQPEAAAATVAPEERQGSDEIADEFEKSVSEKAEEEEEEVEVVSGGSPDSKSQTSPESPTKKTQFSTDESPRFAEPSLSSSPAKNVSTDVLLSETLDLVKSVSKQNVKIQVSSSSKKSISVWSPKAKRSGTRDLASAEDQIRSRIAEAGHDSPEKQIGAGVLNATDAAQSLFEQQFANESTKKRLQIGSRSVSASSEGPAADTVTGFMARLATLAAPDAWNEQDEIDLANQEIEKSTTLIYALERQLAEKNVDNGDLTIALEDERKEKDEMRAHLDNERKEKDAIKAQLDKALADLVQAREKSKQAVEAAHNQADEFEKVADETIGALQSELDKKKKKNASLEKELAECKHQISSLHDEKDVVNEDLRQARADLHRAAQDNLDLAAAASGSGDAEKALNSQLELERSHVAMLLQKVQELEANNAALSTKVQEFERETVHLSSRSSIST